MAPALRIESTREDHAHSLWHHEALQFLHGGGPLDDASQHQGAGQPGQAEHLPWGWGSFVRVLCGRGREPAPSNLYRRKTSCGYTRLKQPAFVTHSGPWGIKPRRIAPG